MKTLEQHLQLEKSKDFQKQLTIDGAQKAVVSWLQEKRVEEVDHQRGHEIANEYTDDTVIVFIDELVGELEEACGQP